MVDRFLVEKYVKFLCLSGVPASLKLSLQALLYCLCNLCHYICDWMHNPYKFLISLSAPVMCFIVWKLVLAHFRIVDFFTELTNSMISFCRSLFTNTLCQNSYLYRIAVINIFRIYFFFIFYLPSNFHLPNTYINFWSAGSSIAGEISVNVEKRQANT